MAELEEYDGIMRRWLDDGFECPICLGYFRDEREARECKDSHARVLAVGQIVYVTDSITVSGSHNESDYMGSREREAKIVSTGLLESLVEFNDGTRERHKNKWIAAIAKRGKDAI